MTHAKIPTHAVRSSNLVSVGYDGATKRLAIEFANGGIYHMTGVEPEKVERFLGAESLGQFYAKEIRGQYPTDKMTGPCPKCGHVGWIGDPCADCRTETYVDQRGLSAAR